MVLPSAGHRFAGAEYAGLAGRTLAAGALPELRLLERTPPLAEQTAAAVPPPWRALLEACGDQYDVAEEDFVPPAAATAAAASDEPAPAPTVASKRYYWGAGLVYDIVVTLTLHYFA